MKFLTIQTQANEAYARWMEQYPKDRNGIGKKLKELGETPDPATVNDITGNLSWTSTPHCSECQNIGMPVVQIGQEPDYDTNTAWICKKCMTKAVALFV